MHFSAEHGLAIAPSVTLVICDHIGWKSWKLIAQTISPTPSLFVAKRRSTYSQGNGEIWGRLPVEVGYGKVACWRTKATIYMKLVKMEEKLLWMAYRNSPTLFRTVPPPTPYGLPFLDIGGLQLIPGGPGTGKATDSSSVSLTLTKVISH